MTNRILVVSLLGLALLGCNSEDLNKTAPSSAKQVSRLNYGYRDNSPEFTKVTATYGPLVVRETGPNGIQAGAIREDKTDWIPWSGYWYPTNSKILFEGQNSTLKKYDRLMAQINGSPSRAADYEEANIYEPNSLSWYGNCDAWSKAALFAPEPKHGVGEFTVADIKALLVKSYQSVDNDLIEYFGQRNNGGPEANYQDIYPDQFHRFLQAELFEDHHPFIMDKDPGEEVWNMPMYWASTTLTRDADPRIMHVRTDVKGANFWGSHDEGIRRVLVKTYTYDLMGIPNSDGSLSVEYGKWTGASYKDHPDFVSAIRKRNALHRSTNPQVDTKIVDQLVEASRR